MLIFALAVKRVRAPVCINQKTELSQAKQFKRRIKRDVSGGVKASIPKMLATRCIMPRACVSKWLSSDKFNLDDYSDRLFEHLMQTP